MTQRHKHADVIHAWAEGAEIEFKVQATGDWRKTDTPSWQEDYEYRIKPPARKYRVALFNNGAEGYTSTADNQEDSNDHEDMPHFVRWLTDWIEYER